MTLVSRCVTSNKNSIRENSRYRHEKLSHTRARYFCRDISQLLGKRQEKKFRGKVTICRTIDFSLIYLKIPLHLMFLGPVQWQIITSIMNYLEFFCDYVSDFLFLIWNRRYFFMLSLSSPIFFTTPTTLRNSYSFRNIAWYFTSHQLVFANRWRIFVILLSKRRSLVTIIGKTSSNLEFSFSL